MNPFTIKFKDGRESTVWKMVKFNVKSYFDRHWLDTPTEGTCQRCKGLFMLRELHWTRYCLFRSWIAALCQECWGGLTPETRLPYYQAVYKRWEEMGLTKWWGPWGLIRDKVLKGK